MSSRPPSVRFFASIRHGPYPAAASDVSSLQGLAARAGDDGIDVEDERDAAVAEDGGGGDARHMRVVGFQALDDDLALALDGIDHQRALAAAFGFHQKRDAVDRIGLGRAEVRIAADIDQRAEGVADRDQPLCSRRSEWIAAASGCRVSTIAVSGTTSVWPATVTTMPSSTASVSGRLMVKVEPWPGFEVIEMRPPSAWIERLTTSMPTPRPEMSEILSAVEKPGMEDQVVDLLVGQVGVGRDQALVDRLLADLLAVDAGAVVGRPR